MLRELTIRSKDDLFAARDRAWPCPATWLLPIPAGSGSSPLRERAPRSVSRFCGMAMRRLDSGGEGDDHEKEGEEVPLGRSEADVPRIRAGQVGGAVELEEETSGFGL